MTTDTLLRINNASSRMMSQALTCKNEVELRKIEVSAVEAMARTRLLANRGKCSDDQFDALVNAVEDVLEAVRVRREEGF